MTAANWGCELRPAPLLWGRLPAGRRAGRLEAGPTMMPAGRLEAGPTERSRKHPMIVTIDGPSVPRQE